jgi:hypothetical protein
MLEDQLGDCQLMRVLCLTVAQYTKNMEATISFSTAIEIPRWFQGLLIYDEVPNVLGRYTPLRTCSAPGS